MASTNDESVQESEGPTPQRNDDKDEPLQRSPPPLSHKELSDLITRVSEKEEKLRQLKLLHYYQNKHTILELKELVETWKEVARTALHDLYERKKFACGDLSMGALLQHLDIEPSLIDIDIESS